jgi:hypothetical protein
MAQASELTGYPLETLDADALVAKDLNIGQDQLQKIIENSSRLLNVDLHLDFEPLKERSCDRSPQFSGRMMKEQVQIDLPDIQKDFQRFKCIILKHGCGIFKWRWLKLHFPNCLNGGESGVRMIGRM